MTLKNVFRVSVISTVAAGALAGCGIKVDERTVPAGNLVGPSKKAFYDGGKLQEGLKNDVFFNNVTFLWPDKVPGAVVEMVLRASDAITKNDDEGIEQKQKMQAIDKRIETAKAELAEVLAAAALDDATLEKIESVGQKLEEKSGLTPMPEDQDYARMLAEEIDALNAELGELPDAVKSAKSKRDSLFGTRERLNHELYRLGKIGEQLLAIIEHNTDQFVKPERVTIDTSNGAPKVTIVDWPVKGVTHSSDNGSVQNVTYEPEEFGRIKFLVETEPGKQYYRFRMVRSRMSVTDGRIFFQGDMDRYDSDIKAHFEGRKPDRRGVVKLVNRN